MMKLSAAIVAIGVFVIRVKKIIVWVYVKWTDLYPILLPLIKEAEQLALDGVINKADRKKLVMDAVKIAELNGWIKLNWLAKRFLPMVIDKIAYSLPDFIITQQAKDIIARLTE